MKNIVDFDTIRDIDIEPIDYQNTKIKMFSVEGANLVNTELGYFVKISSEEDIDKLTLSIYNGIDNFNNSIVSTEGIGDWVNKIKEFLVWIMKRVDKFILYLEKIYVEAKIIISKLFRRIDKCVNDEFCFIIFNKKFYEEPRVYCYDLFSIGGCLHSNIDYVLDNLVHYITESLRVCYKVLCNPHMDITLPKFNRNNIAEFNYILRGKGYSILNNEIVNKDLEFMKGYEYRNYIVKKEMKVTLDKLDDYYRSVIDIKKLCNEIKYKNKELIKNLPNFTDNNILERIRLYGGILPTNYLNMYNELGRNVGWVLKRLISSNPTSPAELKAIIGGIG